MTAPSWAPDTAAVARHIPSRTRAVGTDDTYQYDFTAATTPVNATVVQLIGDACTRVQSVVGLPVAIEAEAACALAASLWAAYSVELGFPERDADVQVYEELRKQAETATAAAAAVNTAAGGGTQEDPTPGDTVLAQHSFPDAPAWADLIGF